MEIAHLKYGIVANLKSWKWLIHHCIMILLLFPHTPKSELRFCYEEHGPHKIQEVDCPGGFIAFRPLNTSCLYYAKGADDIPDLHVTFSGNMCGITPDVELNASGNNNLMNYTSFHSIFFDVLDETADTAAPGIDIDPNTCTLECLSEWHDFTKPQDDPRQIDIPSVSDAELEQYESSYVSLAQELFTLLAKDEDLFDDDVSEEGEENVAPTIKDSDKLLESFLSAKNITDKELSLEELFNIIKLLMLSMRIVIRKCEPFIGTNFYVQVLKAMIHFHSKNPVNSMVDLDVKSYKKISKLLKACEESKNKTFIVSGNQTSCGDMPVLASIRSLTGEEMESWTYRLQSQSFRWGVYDPIIESAWVAVDFVHGFCFQTFYKAESILHFHWYVEAMRALFPREPVQKHWMYPVKLKNDDNFWNEIMDTNDIKTQMRNLDACAIAAYMDKAMSPFNQRLPRPFVSEEQLENPSYASPTDEDNQSGKGWKKSVSEYWKWYERHGGFKEISKNFGFCLDGSRENLEKVEASLKEKGLNC